MRLVLWTADNYNQIMSWLLLALLAHFGNALVFVVDKSLLSGKSGLADPVRYTFYSALLAGAAIVILPWSYVPLTGFILIWSLVAGLLHIIALWLFFNALRGAEPSRIVPVAGSAVPFFTLIISHYFLNESLAAPQWFAIFLLICGGVLLSINFRTTRRIPVLMITFAVLSGLCFAAYFACVKYLYDNSPSFLGSFVYSRVVESLIALTVIGPLLWLRSGRTAAPTKARSGGQKIVAPSLFVGNKVLAAAAFLLQNYAISLGSVTIVNALQGTQYIFVLILAAVVSVKFPQLFGEELHRVALTQKITGVLAVTIGLFMLI